MVTNIFAVDQTNPEIKFAYLASREERIQLGH